MSQRFGPWFYLNNSLIPSLALSTKYLFNHCYFFIIEFIHNQELILLVYCGKNVLKVSIFSPICFNKLWKLFNIFSLLQMNFFADFLKWKNIVKNTYYLEIFHIYFISLIFEKYIFSDKSWVKNSLLCIL